MKHKDHYDDEYILDLSEKIHSVIPEFDKQSFSNMLIGNLNDKELYARFDTIVDSLETCLPGDYEENIEKFYGFLGPELKTPEGMLNFGWWLWPISRYVERNGNENWKVSLAFLKELTKRFTGEFAIRPLLREHPKEVLDELLVWTKDDNVHVRRLASEGIRIRLPWSFKLMVAIEEFDRYSRILTKLRNDPMKVVQKSVGNNLNDLFKESPIKAKLIISNWREMTPSKETEWIIKHGTRNQKTKGEK